jgi:hypothetical protein
MIAKIFEEVNNMLEEPYEKQPTKKRPHVNGNIISKFFATKFFYKKSDMKHKQFKKDLDVLIVKNHLLHIVESQWLKRFSLHLCPKVILLSRK